MSWNKVVTSEPSKIIELPYRSPDPLEIYSFRYLEATPGVDCEEAFERQRVEILDHFDSNCSVLCFGSGHSFWANKMSALPNVSSVSVLDYVREAGVGLDSNIDFYCADILTDSIVGTYDYVFSAHTIEHFDRDQILMKVLPSCLAVARKAVIFLVPYKENWSDEPSHRCLFYLGDELSSRAEKYKLIRDDLELVLWFKGEAG